MRSASALQCVLSCLLEQEEPVSRPDLAQACGLSRPTVFTAVERLEGLGMVERVGQANGRPGRSPVLYQVARSAGLLAAVDIGGSNVRVAFGDARGQVLAERQAPTASGGGARILEQVLELAGQARQSLTMPEQPITLTVVSVPGVVASDGRTVLHASNINQPTPLNFSTPLSRGLDTEVVLENNVNLAAVAERWRGVATDLETFVVVAVGAGIGAGIVHGGHVLRGAHGAAGEVAFLPPYGQRHRLDHRAYDEAGGLSLLQQAQAQPGWTSSVPETVEEVFARAAAGEEPAVTLVADECERVATAIAAVCAVVDPQKVVLTGGLAGNDALLAGTERRVVEMTIFPPPVVRSALGERASLIGALRLAAQRRRQSLLAAIAEGAELAPVTVEGHAKALN